MGNCQNAFAASRGPGARWGRLQTALPRPSWVINGEHEWKEQGREREQTEKKMKERERYRRKERAE